MKRPFERDDKVLDPADPSPVRARFEPIESASALDAVLGDDSPAPTLLFLHDPYCPISSMAFEEVERVDAAVQIIDVSQHSALGRTVEARTGVRHESPQVIVLRAGVPAWHASHGRIRTERVREALGAG